MTPIHQKQKKQKKRSDIKLTGKAGRIWTNPEFFDEVQCVKNERAQETVEETAKKRLTTIRKARAAGRKVALQELKDKREADLAGWRFEVEQHKVSTVRGKGRAPKMPIAPPKPMVPDHLFSPNKRVITGDDGDELNDDDKGSQGSGGTDSGMEE
ncbi:hypothetical protein FRB94_001926 [Tulasnella sp. JGI-2019a]|nr:hypothetical protein FRB94_001926 [Tulasnella sp. JGI-2019a]